MKKFSNISNVKVSEEPKIEVKQLNEEEKALLDESAKAVKSVMDVLDNMNVNA